MSRRKGKVSPAAVRAYRLMMSLRKPGDDNAQSEEYFEAARALDQLVQRQPWQVQVLEALDEGEPPSWYRADQVRDWHEAFQIGRALQEAAKA